MLFLLLLMIAAFSIAGSAAFFSVFGLANTFHGTFWAVVVMGGSLEFGKLMATSFLYRFWTVINSSLKYILMCLVISLMILTSTGIFGFLSTGYQTDAISFKQIERKVELLDNEKKRLIERKQQIDNQIASLPADTSRGRISLIKGFKDEQTQVTARISSIEAEELETKTKLIQSEAHVGPILYIAKAFGLNPDDATKYLIYLIIFIFDPMAVALTLAVNVVLRERANQKTTVDVVVDERSMEIPPMEEVVDEEEQFHEDVVAEPYQPEESEFVIAETTHEIIGNSDDNNVLEVVEVQPQDTTAEPTHQKTQLEELVAQYHAYKARIDRGERLSLDDHWQFTSIRDTLQSQGFNVYI